MNTTRTSLFLMANLGAEVSRIISAKERGDDAMMRGAVQRADQMLREIESLPDMQSRVDEIEILSRVIHSFTDSASRIQVTSQNIKSYFTPFALRLITR